MLRGLMMSYKILCCDGGGIRGLITALLIQDLNKKFKVIQRADGFAGTSTGGLIALGLANGNDISEIVSIYESEGSTIFQENSRFLEELESSSSDLIKELATESEFFSGPGIFSCQYKNDGLKQVAEKLLGTKKLADASKLLVVNSARLWNGTSWDSAALSNTPNSKYREMKMVDAALATSAAPTYFPPYCINPFGFFADGGTFANNPSVTAISEAIANRKVKSIEDLYILSLGTGESPQGIPPEAIGNPLKWGVTHWLWPLSSGKVPKLALLNLILDCTARVATAQAQQILGKHRYCRGNFILKSPIALDDWRQVSELKQETEKYMQSADWKQVCTWVEKTWT